MSDKEEVIVQEEAQQNKTEETQETNDETKEEEVKPEETQQPEKVDEPEKIEEDKEVKEEVTEEKPELVEEKTEEVETKPEPVEEEVKETVVETPAQEEIPLKDDQDVAEAEKDEPAKERAKTSSDMATEETFEIGDDQEDKPELDTGIEVEVKNPTVIKDSVVKGSFIKYDVEGVDKNGTFNIKRRYKDFFDLRSKLVEQWPGIHIPPIPEKKATGNTESDFVIERKSLLNYFLKRISKLPYLHYSPPVQSFLRSVDDQFRKEFSALKPPSSQEVLDKYKESFPDLSEMEYKSSTGESVDRYFIILKSTEDFYKNFARVTRYYSKLKNKNTLLYAGFIKTAVSDYKRELSMEEQEVSLKQYTEFIDTCSQDELKDLGLCVNELSLEFTTLMELKNNLKSVIRQAEEARRRQSDATRDLTKIRAMDGDQVKSGIFGGKVNKADKIKEIEDSIVQHTQCMDDWIKIKEIVYNVLNFDEFPRIIATKNRLLSNVVRKYYTARTQVIKTELAMLKEIESHYKKYATVNTTQLS